MTQPIQEPGTSTRTDAKSTWATNQLFRRPAPVSGGECDRAYMQAVDFQTIANNTTTVLTDYDPDLSVTGVDIATDETPGEFSVTATGIYLAQLMVLYVNSFNAAKFARIQLLGGEVLQGTNYWTNWVSEDDPGLNVDQVVVQALIFIVGVSTAVEIAGATRQESGISQDVLEVDFSIVKICDYVAPPDE